MKRSIVPAQITTVEDHIFGGLSPQQLVLMIAPVCVGFLAYALAPPNFHLTLYKLAILVVLEVIGATLSIRVKDKILLFWMVTVARYNIRPRYYLYNKNDDYLRDTSMVAAAALLEQDATETVKVAPKVPKLPLLDVVRLQEIMADPRANLRFDTGKDGGLRVIIQEIKQ